MKQRQNECNEREEEFKSSYLPPPDYAKASIGDGASLMPSISTVQPPTHSWTSKFLPNKVVEKRQKNYEKRVLKKIQEDQISHAPACEDLPSVKAKSATEIPEKHEKVEKNDATKITMPEEMPETNKKTHEKEQKKASRETKVDEKKEDSFSTKSEESNDSKEKGDTIKVRNLYSI